MCVCVCACVLLPSQHKVGLWDLCCFVVLPPLWFSFWACRRRCHLNVTESEWKRAWRGCVLQSVCILWGCAFPLSLRSDSSWVWETLIWTRLTLCDETNCGTQGHSDPSSLHSEPGELCSEAQGRPFLYTPLGTEKWTPGPESFYAQWSCEALNCFTRCNRPPEMSQRAVWS